MDAKLTSRICLFFTLLAFSSCSKFDRLTNSERVARVQVGASREAVNSPRGPNGGFSMLGTAQQGGVIVWARNERDNVSAAVLLATDTDSTAKPLALAFGIWDFYAVGYAGGGTSDVFSGAVQCGTNLGFQVNSNTTSATIGISLAGCAAHPFFGLSTGPIKPIRFVTCNSTANPTTGANGCAGTTKGDLRSFEVIAHRFEPVGNNGAPVSTQQRVGGCVSLANPSTDNFIVSSFRVPDGTSGISPMYFTVNGYTATGCGSGGGTKVVYPFKRGMRNGAEGSTALFKDGSSTFISSNALYLFHGSPPGPSVSSISPAIIGGGGMTEITITGTDFDAGASITTGGVSCAATFVDSQHLKCTPSLSTSLGTKSVIVTNSDSQQSTGSYTVADDGFGIATDAAAVGSTLTLADSFVTTATTANSNQLLGGRPFHSYFNVTAIASVTSGTDVAGKTLTVDATLPLSSSDIASGDTVLWHVSAFNSLSACSTNGDLGLGVYGVSLVTNVSSSDGKVTLRDVVTTTPNAASILESNRVAGTQFCVIQLVRIPSLQNLSINTVSSPSITAPAFSLSTGKGGIIAMQVNDTFSVFGASGFVDVNVTGMGFVGGGSLSQGVGWRGLGTGLLASNTTGGGSAQGGPAKGAGGGGSIGGGGDGGNNSGSAGDVLGTCDPLAGKCAMFGGGGGGGNGFSGGNGGGIVLLFARKVSANNNINLAAEGLSGQGSSAGGGGGGTAYVRSLDASGSTFALFASGGQGSAGSQGGGGGGGGIAKHAGCLSAPATSATTHVLGGTASSGGFGGSAGDGASGDSASGDNFCP